ncbi:MAG: BatD family protein [Bacteroidales bacterium]|jgi:predicted house-cleaning noncanonical NTP pyrophosphatase (MazG superfamily)|nr:BatD family protein [Bacteroidales bacterium]
MSKKIFLMLLMLFAAGGIAVADEITFKMEAPKVVAMGQQFRLKFIVNSLSSGDLKLPDLGKFHILTQSESSSVSSFFDGKATQQQAEYTYLFILQAKELGTFTIQPATITVDKKIYSSNSLSIQVVPEQPGQQGQGSQSQQSGGLTKDDLFIRMNVSKRTVYKGEQLSAAMKIFWTPRVPLASFDNYVFPSFTGFWTQEVKINPKITPSEEVENGVIYNTAILKRSILIPQQTGQLTIEPFSLTCLLRQRMGMFDIGTTTSAPISTAPVTITVKELPPAPEGFTGGVGALNFSASIDKLNVNTNDAVTLRITISGSGNLQLVEAPKIDFPSDLNLFDPKVTDNIQTRDDGISGSKTFEYLFIPRNPGDFIIPPVRFASFNPATGQYSVQTSDEFKLHVEKGVGDSETTVTSIAAKEDIRLVGKDIRYIMQGRYRLRPLTAVFFGSPTYWGLFAGTVLLFVIIVLLLRGLRRRNADVAMTLTRKASKMARKRLRDACIFMKQNKAEEYHEAVLKAFWGYLSHKLNIPVSELSRDMAAERLADRNVKPEVVEEFIKLLDTSEFYRYSPVGSGATLESLYENAVTLMGKIDKQIR